MNANLGKWMVGLGLIIATIGILVWLGAKAGIPFGKLPGDINVEKGKYAVSFPIVTCIVISLLITLFINFIFWIRK